jgi:hypothetical protein
MSRQVFILDFCVKAIKESTRALHNDVVCLTAFTNYPLG